MITNIVSHNKKEKKKRKEKKIKISGKKYIGGHDPS
jgi:hypothetical protein